MLPCFWLLWAEKVLGGTLAKAAGGKYWCLHPLSSQTVLPAAVGPDPMARLWRSVALSTFFRHWTLDGLFCAFKLCHQIS